MRLALTLLVALTGEATTTSVDFWAARVRPLWKTPLSWRKLWFEQMLGVSAKDFADDTCMHTRNFVNLIRKGRGGQGKGVPANKHRNGPTAWPGCLVNPGPTTRDLRQALSDPDWLDWFGSSLASSKDQLIWDLNQQGLTLNLDRFSPRPGHLPIVVTTVVFNIGQLVHSLAHLRTVHGIEDSTVIIVSEGIDLEWLTLLPMHLDFCVARIFIVPLAQCADTHRALRLLGTGQNKAVKVQEDQAPLPSSNNGTAFLRKRRANKDHLKNAKINVQFLWIMDMVNRLGHKAAMVIEVPTGPGTDDMKPTPDMYHYSQALTTWGLAQPGIVGIAASSYSEHWACGGHMECLLSACGTTRFTDLHKALSTSHLQVLLSNLIMPWGCTYFVDFFEEVLEFFLSNPHHLYLSRYDWVTNWLIGNRSTVVPVVPRVMGDPKWSTFVHYFPKISSAALLDTYSIIHPSQRTIVTNMSDSHSG
eukprot:gene6611-1179_t